MSRARGGYIGFNRVPAAAGVNSAASGVWTLREAEALRRAGTWPTTFSDPTTFSGLQLWLDASDASTLFDATTGGSLVTADGGVARWEDKSGNARHATQSTSGNRPQRKTALISALDAITFDGTNDRLFVPASSVAFGTSNFEMFIVARSRAPSGSQGFFVFQDNTSGFSPIIRTTVAANNLKFTFRTTGTTAFDITDTATYSSNSLVMLGVRRASSTITATKNGSAFGSSAISGSFGATSVTPGVGAYFDSDSLSAWFLDGEICEIIIYNSALSNTDRGSVESYLMSKWGIT
jgi:hypothetical protein